MSNVRKENFVFTHNNYPNTTLQDTIDCKYIIYGKEIGESGTPHLQGFVRFESKKSLAQVIALLPGCHVEVAIAPQSAIEYCKKDGDFTERGIAPLSQKRKGETEKERWNEIKTLAKAGRLDEIDSEVYVRNYRTLKEIAKDHMPQVPDATELPGEWFYGPAGTGKSRAAREENPVAYAKPLNQWWDGYQDEPVVIVDDMDPFHKSLAYEFKMWGDRYAFVAPIKGGALRIRPTKVIVTSQYMPEEIWEDAATLEAINRRFKLRRFGSDELDRPDPIAKCFKCHMNN
uniref:ATP-dependent helicase Rep n=1 Tax=Sewage-associated circular DNA molecule TaxID=1592207 RepID=A0A0B4UH05_9VIRU|nr:replication-associated protein [Sewage-associated circular DNA molecule]